VFAGRLQLIELEAHARLGEQLSPSGLSGPRLRLRHARDGLARRGAEPSPRRVWTASGGCRGHAASHNGWRRLHGVLPPLLAHQLGVGRQHAQWVGWNVISIDGESFT